MLLELLFLIEREKGRVKLFFSLVYCDYVSLWDEMSLAILIVNAPIRFMRFTKSVVTKSLLLKKTFKGSYFTQLNSEILVTKVMTVGFLQLSCIDSD